MKYRNTLQSTKEAGVPDSPTWRWSKWKESPKKFQKRWKKYNSFGKILGFQMDMFFQVGFVPVSDPTVSRCPIARLPISTLRKSREAGRSHLRHTGSQSSNCAAELAANFWGSSTKKPVFWKKPMVNDGKWSKESNFSEKSVRFFGCVAKKFLVSLNPQAAADPTFIYWSRDPIALKDAGRHGIDMLWKRCMEIIATGLIVVLKVLLPFSVWYSFCWIKSQLIMFWMIDSFEALILVRSLRMNHRVIHQSSNPCPFMLWLCFEDSFFKEATDACMLWSAIFFAVLLVGGPRQSPPTWCQLWWGDQDLVSDGLRCSPFAQPGGGW